MFIPNRTFQSLNQALFICQRFQTQLLFFMSRGRSERKDKNYEVQTFGRQDPFQEMHQMMRHFGGFGRDDFFGGLGHFDPLQQMMDFSSAHRGLHGQGNGGSYACQTFVSSSTMGRDGKMQTESYFQNSAGQNKNGQTISQKQQAYKNSDGLKRVAEERMLNDKGHKVMKEKRGDQVEQTNHYYNMEDHEADRFHQEWGTVNRDMKFLENVGRVQQSIGNGQRPQERLRGIGYEPPRREERQAELQNGSRHGQGAYRQQPQRQEQMQSRGGASQKSSGLKDTRRQY